MRWLAAAMRRMNGWREIPEMTPQELQIKAKKLYDVVHAQPEARKTLFPEHLLVFSDGYDTNSEALVRTMKNIRDSLSEASHKFILRNVFNGDTNMSERQKFIDILEYILEIAKSLTDISPDFNVSFKEMQEILWKYPNDVQFTQLLDKINQYVSQSTGKKDALHDALEAARERAATLVEDADEGSEEAEEDTLRGTWDNLVNILNLDTDAIPQELIALIPDFQAINTEEKKVDEMSVSTLVTYIADYIRQNPNKVIDILITADIKDGIDEFDERSPIKFRELVAQWFSEKSL